MDKLEPIEVKKKYFGFFRKNAWPWEGLENGDFHWIRRKDYKKSPIDLGLPLFSFSSRRSIDLLNLTFPDENHLIGWIRFIANFESIHKQNYMTRFKIGQLLGQANKNVLGIWERDYWINSNDTGCLKSSSHPGFAKIWGTVTVGLYANPGNAPC